MNKGYCDMGLAGSSGVCAIVFCWMVDGYDDGPTVVSVAMH